MVYLDNHEITGFRIDLNSIFNKTKTALVAQMAISTVGGAACVVASTLTNSAINLCMDNLISEIERWESRGKAIVVKIPCLIHGWDVYAQ